LFCPYALMPHTSCLILIHDYFEAVEVYLDSFSVGQDASLCRCVLVKYLTGGCVGEVGGNTLGIEALLSSSRS
jgi:hypothetical protein